MQYNKCSTPPRGSSRYVLVVVAVLVAATLLLASNVRPAQQTAAQSSYDLCDRTTAVRDAILLALQYPDRNTSTSNYGTVNASYSTWGTFDTSAGSYTSVNCTSSNRLTISATALASDASWIGWTKAMDLTNKGLTYLWPSDFAGLTQVEDLYIGANSIRWIEDDIFEGKGVKNLFSNYGNFRLAPRWQWFGTDAPNVVSLQFANNRLRHSDISPTAFDGFFDSSEANAADASKLGSIYMEGQAELGHINLRWFERLVNLDEFGLTGGSKIDTYFYADGWTRSRSLESRTVRKVDGSSTAATGATDFTADTTTARDAIGTAIKAEIDRFWNEAKSTTGGVASGTAGIATTGRVTGVTPGFNLCDTYDRHPAVAEHIISVLKDPDRDTDTAIPAAYTSFGCPNVSVIDKAALGTDAAWTHWRTPFAPASSAMTALNRSDIKGLSISHIRLNGTRVAEIEEGIFQGVTPGVEVLEAKWLRRLRINLKAWFGTSASDLVSLAMPSSLANHTDIAYNEFDGFTNLEYIDLRDTPLGYVNTRWFANMSNLTGLMLGATHIAKFFNDTDGNDPNHASTTGVTDFWEKTPLQTAINSARTGASNTALATTGNAGFFNATAGYSVPGLAVDVCDRPKAMWAELMRIFDYIDDSLPEEFRGSDVQPWHARWVTNTGDVRHARYERLTAADCQAVPAIAIVKDSLATVDPDSTAYDATEHDRSIYKAGYTLDLRLYDTYSDPNSDTYGLGPELDPADFANFYHVNSINLSRSGITSIPSNTFQSARDVTSLSLAGNLLDDADFAGSNFLSSFSKLATLNLSDNLLTEFDSSWLPSASRGTVRSLSLSNNPLKTFDISGLDLTTFRINGTQVSSLHSSFYDQDNLKSFWYQTPTLRLDGLHTEGPAKFLSELPASLANSEPYGFIGNALMAEDSELDSAALQFQLDHQARMKAINAGVTGADSRITTAVLRDPCRPDIDSIGSTEDWGDSSETGNLCLTDAQKNSFISSVSGYNGLNWVRTHNADLSDSQMVQLLKNFEDQPMRRINLISNPNAFGSGFDDSQLSVFNNLDWRGVWQLQIVHSALNYSQASTILSNMAAGAFEPSVRRNEEGEVRWNQHYFEELDLSYNPDLFTGATTAQLSTFLNGVTAIRDGWGPFRLKLAGTNLDYDKFDAILDSIQQHDVAPYNVYGIQVLDVSDNPNLWNRRNPSDGSWEDVSNQEIGAMALRLEGITSLDISDTGLTGWELERFLVALDNVVGIPPHLAGLGPSQRMSSLAVAGTDLGAISPTDPADLSTMFSVFSVNYSATAAPALRSLNLARTNINCEDLNEILDGLEIRGDLNRLTSLNLDGNPNIFTGCPSTNTDYECDSTSNTDQVAGLFGRFTNLRTLSIDGASVEFNELECVVAGLDSSDGGTAADGAVQIRTINIENNPEAFSVPDPDDAEERVPAPNAEVVAMFNALPNAYKALRNTGLTVEQASAVLVELQEGESESDREEIARRFAAQNPVFTFKTPLPIDLKVESGRSSVRVAFTHDPKTEDGQSFTVLRYEYRYREIANRAAAAMSWGTSVTEKWRTASLGSLEEAGRREFIIYGLKPDALYQVQLRASSLAQPAIASEVGGTMINLPIIDKIEPAITEVSLRAGDSVRLEVDVYGRAGILDNTIPEKNARLVFNWAESSGSFATPDKERRVVYTAPSLPGTYTVSVEAAPLGVCTDHHRDDFDISDKNRAPCMATITIRVSRGPAPPEPPADPINPAGLIPSSFTDSSGVAYSVFTPVGGGTFTGEGITVSAVKGAVPDRQLLGVSAAVSTVSAPDPVPGARMTIAATLYDINGVQQDGASPVSDFKLDEPLMACLPMPTEFSANISDVVLVERKSDGSYGILSTTLRQAVGDLSVCGNVSTLPATVGIAKLGIVPPPPVTPTPEVETPDTGATAPGANTAAWVLGLGMALVAIAMATAAGMSALRRRMTAHDTNTP